MCYTGKCKKEDSMGNCLRPHIYDVKDKNYVPCELDNYEYNQNMIMAEQDAINMAMCEDGQ